MRDKFKELPEVLQRQVIYRVAAGGLSMLLCLIVLILHHSFYLCLSFVFFAVVFCCSGLFLFLRVVSGKYVSIEGRCSRIDKSFLRKRTNTIFFEADPHKIKLHLRQNLKNISTGDDIVVYVLDNTSVYQEEGYEVLGGYIAIERKKGRE